MHAQSEHQCTHVYTFTGTLRKTKLTAHNATVYHKDTHFVGQCTKAPSRAKSLEYGEAHTEE